MIRKLLIVSKSKGKLPEIAKALQGLDFEFLNLDDIKEIPKDFEVEETGQTYEENAILKAKTFGKMTGLLTLADDSGLEIDALGGKPGIYSRRWIPGDYPRKCQKVLEMLKDLPEEKRGARFVCVIAIYDSVKNEVRTCRGVYQGQIALEPKGDFGFGYDPIFYNPDFGKTTAEISLEQKQKISHRGKALEKAREILKEFME
jgi:XTP/dITP diphosphohydrolase